MRRCDYCHKYGHTREVCRSWATEQRQEEMIRIMRVLERQQNTTHPPFQNTLQPPNWQHPHPQQPFQYPGQPHNWQPQAWQQPGWNGPANQGRY